MLCYYRVDKEVNEELAREQQKLTEIESKKESKKVSRKESVKSSDKLASKGKVVKTHSSGSSNKDLVERSAASKDNPSQVDRSNLNNNESKPEGNISAVGPGGAHSNTVMKDKSPDSLDESITDGSSKPSSTEKAIGIQVQPSENASPVKKKSFFSRLYKSNNSKSSRKSKLSTRVVYNASVEESAM